MASFDSFERCCRLCAEEQEVTVMIFSKEAEAMLLQNKLNKYLLIEVDEDDKLPKNICIKCCSTLQTVCDFIDTAHKAQEILHNQSISLENHEDYQKASNLNPKVKLEPVHHDDNKATTMEVNVDPMMVLQNSEDSSNTEETNECMTQDLIYLHGADGEDVTIKLIKKGDTSEDKKETNDDKKDTSEDKRDNVVKPFPCLSCNRSFFTELALKNHSWTHFNEDKAIKPFKCSFCGEYFDYKSELMAHLKKHRSSGVCQICGRLFRSERNLVIHMAAHASSTTKSYTCKVCGRSYNTSSNLKTHSVTHSNERPYKCHYCKKTFKRNQDLKFHINQHTGAKPYQCPFCEKSFASSGNCYSHKSRMHPGRRTESKLKKRLRDSAPRDQSTKIRPVPPKPSPIASLKTARLQCTLCDHSFLRRDNYTYHMYQHTGEKPFQCTFCNAKFVTRRGLLIHHEKNHPEKDAPLAILSKNILLK